MKSEEQRRILHKIEKGMLTEADLNTIEEMGIAEELEQYKKILLASSRLQIPNASSSGAAWPKLMDEVEDSNQIPTDRPKAIQSSMVLGWSLGIAATVLLLVVAWFWPTTITSTPGELVDHELPDGSKLSLNVGSSVTYYPIRYHWRRQVQHEGEIFYEIRPGASFEVHSESFTVEVLGTSFNVVDRPGKRSVTC